MSPMDPINRLIIRSWSGPGGYHELAVSLDEKGAIVMEGVDGGEDVRELTGDWDYEYWLAVPPEYSISVLLHLIKDRFESTTDFKKWLEERGIPYNFTSF